MTHFLHYKNEPTSAKKVSIFPQRMQEDPANQSQNCRGFEKRLTRCMSVLQLLSIHECLRRAGSCCSPAWGGNSNNWWREKRPLANNSRWEKKTLRCFVSVRVFSIYSKRRSPNTCLADSGVRTRANEPVSARASPVGRRTARKDNPPSLPFLPCIPVVKWRKYGSESAEINMTEITAILWINNTAYSIVRFWCTILSEIESVICSNTVQQASARFHHLNDQKSHVLDVVLRAPQMGFHGSTTDTYFCMRHAVGGVEQIHSSMHIYRRRCCGVCWAGLLVWKQVHIGNIFKLNKEPVWSLSAWNIKQMVDVLHH